MLNQQFIRFVLVGLLNTVFGYSLFAFFLYIGAIYPLAVFLSTIFGILFNYKTIGKIVFSSTKNKLVPFVLVYVALYLLNVFCLWFLSILGLENMYISGAILLAPLAIFSYYLNRNFVFS